MGNGTHDDGDPWAWLRRGGGTELTGKVDVQTGNLMWKEPGKWPDANATCGFVYGLGLAGATVNRAVGSSPLLYVGQGGGPRVGAWKDGTHTQVQHLRGLVEALTREGNVAPVCVALRYRESKDPELEEALELAIYGLLHGELPPLNRAHEGWLAGIALNALAKRAAADTRAWNRAYDWPTVIEDSSLYPRATWVEIYRDQRGSDYLCSIGWIWPGSWLPSGAKKPEAALRGKLVLVTKAADGGSAGRLAEQLGEGHDAWKGWEIKHMWSAEFLAGGGSLQTIRKGIDGLLASNRQPWKSIKGIVASPGGA